MTATTPVPLSVLDLSAYPSGGAPADGLRRTIALAQRAEQLGYSRFWLAEHHLNPGISGSSPHVLLAAIADATSRIRLGTAVTVLGNSTPLRVVEDLGVIASLHPGRVDLGIGRSGSKPPGAAPSARQALPDRVVDGLVLPAPRRPPIDAARLAVQARLLGRSEGDGDAFVQDVQDVLDLRDGTFTAPEDVPIHAHPAEGTDIEVWIHGSTAGPSARTAGELGLPFGANYHVLPSFVLDAVAEYRRSFRPGRIPEPHVIVSADVVVAEDDARAQHLALGYAHWVHSIRAGQGAIPYLSPEQALAAPLSAEEQEIVQDRLDTRFVGSPATVAEDLRTLKAATGADELLLTTITHDEQDQQRSFELLAEAWGLTPGA